MKGCGCSMTSSSVTIQAGSLADRSRLNGANNPLTGCKVYNARPSRQQSLNTTAQHSQNSQSFPTPSQQTHPERTMVARLAFFTAALAALSGASASPRPTRIRTDSQLSPPRPSRCRSGPPRATRPTPSSSTTSPARLCSSCLASSASRATTSARTPSSE